MTSSISSSGARSISSVSRTRTKRWGSDGRRQAERGIESGTLPAEGVQKMFDRIAPVYDAMNA
jgi:hypothetical protein